MKESCLRWFGHVQRRVINASVRQSEMIQVEGTKKKGRGRPIITLVEVVKKNVSIKEVREVMTSERIEWRKRIHMTDTN